jgi:hypothetical protein
MRTLTAFAIFPADTTTPTFCEVIFGVRKEPSRFVGLAANGIVVVCDIGDGIDCGGQGRPRGMERSRDARAQRFVERFCSRWRELSSE